ncbi:hypothetical protein M7I_1076 [Glarea lozoyensis 74030]|uniref:DUF7614 domain-containing protein n=1 Tax=Glarea lozoyensis (strain ATCC 74030 / MF5533) TaxID=1104152 RepID=H0EF38_GLAL7|nr:hypothetical protein M7I_1076 [Glarea lozoyensis 74030]
MAKLEGDCAQSRRVTARTVSMIPRAKAWTPLYARLQILNRGKVRQLVAYFQEFSHGKCMNFRLKETDVFEKSKKGGLTILKFVDAKFSLPAGGKNDPGLERGFVCLDLLEYPGEHSNLYLGFDSNSGNLIIFKNISCD